MPTDLEVVQANSAAFSAMDVDAMLALYAEDAVAIDHRARGWGEFRGHEELRSYYGGIFDNADELREDLEVVGARAGLVVCDCRLWARLTSAAGSGEFAVRYGMALTLRDARIARLELYDDGRSALAATLA